MGLFKQDPKKLAARGDVGALKRLAADGRVDALIALLKHWSVTGVSRDRGGDLSEFIENAKQQLNWFDLLMEAFEQGSREYGVRGPVTAALGTTGDPRVFEVLVERLRHKDRDVRHAAVSGLASIPEARAVSSLLEHLVSVRAEETKAAPGQRKDELFWERKMVDERLTTLIQSLGVTAARVLVETLDRAAPDVRKEAISRLRRADDGGAVDSFLVALGDHSPEVRSEAIRAVAGLGDARAVEPLLQILRSDVEPKTRGDAAIALGSLADAHAVGPLIQALQTDESEAVRGDAASALGSLADAHAVGPLIQALQTDESGDVRRGAASALGSLAEARAVEPLIQAVTSDENTDVRLAALRSLGEIADERAVESVIAALTQTGKHDVGSKFLETAASALGKMGSARAIDHLVNAAASPDLAIAEAALRGLASSSDERKVAFLIKVLQEEKRPYMRETAARLLGSAGDSRAIAALEHALNDPHWEISMVLREETTDYPVRRAAESALNALGQRQEQP